MLHRHCGFRFWTRFWGFWHIFLQFWWVGHSGRWGFFVWPCAVVRATMCKHVQSSVRPCTVVCAIVCGKNQFCATMCGRMYERVRPCMAVFEQNICAMMFDCVRWCLTVCDHVQSDKIFFSEKYMYFDTIHRIAPQIVHCFVLFIFFVSRMQVYVKL